MNAAYDAMMMWKASGSFFRALERSGRAPDMPLFPTPNMSVIQELWVLSDAEYAGLRRHLERISGTRQVEGSISSPQDFLFEVRFRDTRPGPVGYVAQIHASRKWPSGHDETSGGWVVSIMLNQRWVRLIHPETRFITAVAPLEPYGFELTSSWGLNHLVDGLLGKSFEDMRGQNTGVDQVAFSMLSNNIQLSVRFMEVMADEHENVVRRSVGDVPGRIVNQSYDTGVFNGSSDDLTQPFRGGGVIQTEQPTRLGYGDYTETPQSDDTVSGDASAPPEWWTARPMRSVFDGEFVSGITGVELMGVASPMATAVIGDEGADFWLIRRGSEDSLGKPVREYDPERIGIRVVNTEALDAGYLFYLMQHLWMSDVWRVNSYGMSSLKNIRVSDVRRFLNSLSSASSLSVSFRVLPHERDGFLIVDDTDLPSTIPGVISRLLGRLRFQA